MNWQEIKEKHPKAFAHLVGPVDEQRLICNAETNEPVEDMDEQPFNLRDLYDFFDEQGIFINPLVDTSLPRRFDAVITIPGKGKEAISYYLPAYVDTRSEAEQAAFTKAFQLLEVKLST